MNKNPKIVSYDRNAAYVHHRAMKNRREQNNVDALELLRHAVGKSPENREYKLDLAELYCEMGCHEQSNRLLLDMLAEEDAPAECYYGLALNRVGLNDMEGAQRALAMYARKAPNGPHSMDVVRLADELEIYDALNRPYSRKAYRAARVSAAACEAMQKDEYARAQRLFERSLALRPAQSETRALYALTLKTLGLDEDAVREARQASSGFAPSVRALCLSGQVLCASDMREEGEKLMREAIAQHPDGAEMRMLLFSLAEVGMDREVSECARLALQETPYDRALIHMAAVSAVKADGDAEYAKRCYLRILRIDPEDTIATYYRDAVSEASFNIDECPYAYQVPEAECRRRLEYIAQGFFGQPDGMNLRWHDDPLFRSYLKWAACTGDVPYQHAAMSAIAAIPDGEAESTLRELLSRNDVSLDIKLHATLLLRLRCANLRKVLPPDVDEIDGLLPEGEEVLRHMTVGHRQLVRLSADVVQDRSTLSALSALALTWQAYRKNRGLRCDPMMRTEGGAAALTYCYLTLHGVKITFDDLAREFGCSQRQMIYFARRLADVLNGGGDTAHEAD